MKNWGKISLLGVFIGLLLTACLSNVELADEVKAAENKTQILSYFTKMNQSPIAMDNGAFYAITKANPSGELASRGDSLVIHYELANLVTGQVLDSKNRKTNSPLIYRYGFTNPVFSKLMAFLKDGEQAVMALPGTSQSFDGLPAYTPLKCTIKSYWVKSQSDQIEAYIAKKGYKVTSTEADGLRYIQ